MEGASDPGEKPCSGSDNILSRAGRPWKLTLTSQSAAISCMSDTADKTDSASMEEHDDNMTYLAMSVQRSKLLSLPGEILNNIYEHCEEDEPSGSFEGPQPRGYRSNGAQYIGLLHTCRQLRVQFRPLWVAKSKFRLEPRGLERFLRAWLSQADCHDLQSESRANVVLILWPNASSEAVLDIAPILKHAACFPNVNIRFETGCSEQNPRGTPLVRVDSLIKILHTDPNCAEIVKDTYACVLDLNTGMSLDCVFRKGKATKSHKHLLHRWWKRIGNFVQTMRWLRVLEKRDDESESYADWCSDDFSARHNEGLLKSWWTC